MTSAGHRPSLSDLLVILDALVRVEADASALNLEAEAFRVVLTFQRDFCPQDWQDGQPKPSWLFDEIKDHLRQWRTQRVRESQWVSKEERMGSSIDTLMAHYAEELKKADAARPETIKTRMDKRVFADTILRLKELQERRAAGGVYSHAESRREKARKTREEEEYAGPQREEEQRRQHDNMNRGWWSGFDPGIDEELRRQTEDLFNSFRRTYGDWGGARTPPPKSPSGNKRSWHEILGVSVKATKEEIKKAHRKLAAKFHPDRYKEPDGHAKMTEINTARDEGLGGL
jgi:DnaJ-domain-containing protein 1